MITKWSWCDQAAQMLSGLVACLVLLTACEPERTLLPGEETWFVWTWENPLPQGQDVTAVWWDGADRILATTTGGTLLSYDNDSWTTTVLKNGVSLNDISGSARNNVYVVGSGGHVFNYNGSKWFVTLITEGGADLRGVWVEGPDNVYAVGEFMYLFGSNYHHYDGQNWRNLGGWDEGDLYRVRGTAGSASYAVSGTTIYRAEGSPITKLPKADFWIEDVWVHSADTIFAVGQDKIALYDGLSWSDLVTGVPGPLHACWGRNPRDLFAGGESGAVCHFDGLVGSVMHFPIARAITGMGGSTEDASVYAVGEIGMVCEYDGFDWRALNRGGTVNINGVSTAKGGEAYAVGQSGTILRYEGDRWTRINSPTENDLNDIWAAPDGRLFAVGDKGTILVHSGSWAMTTIGTNCNLKAISGRSENDIVAVGDSIVVHWDGVAWESADTISQEELMDVTALSDGTSYIISESGNVFRSENDVEWAEVAYLGWRDRYAIWGRNRNDVFVGGWSGELDHFNGSEWTEMDLGKNVTIRDITGDSGRVVAVGDRGTICTYDGKSWKVMEAGTTRQLNAVALIGTKEMRVVGSMGTIMSYQRKTERVSEGN